jgi:hypothetical protein
LVLEVYFKSIEATHNNIPANVAQYQQYLQQSPIAHRQRHGQDIAAMQQTHEQLFAQIAAELKHTPSEALAMQNKQTTKENNTTALG